MPTLPLFVHERLSTKAILETLKGHERDRQMEMQLFADPQLPLHQQLEAYEHKGGWVNRMILGDSLVVMNSLLEYEGLGGQVQMIYIDPPYGVKFGSNFQPFVRKRDVKHDDDEDMTREPEMVKAYRDTWELGLHSYLTYLRDRLLVARELLTPSGQRLRADLDENVHHVRELMDEVFGAENFVAHHCVREDEQRLRATRSPSVCRLSCSGTRGIASRVKYRQLYLPKSAGEAVGQLRLCASSRRTASNDDAGRAGGLERCCPTGRASYALDNLTSQSPRKRGDVRAFEFEGQTFQPGTGTLEDRPGRA